MLKQGKLFNYLILLSLLLMRVSLGMFKNCAVYGI